MNTEDLDSYYPGYDDYCDDIEEQAKVPYCDYARLEEKISLYENCVEDIESLYDEEHTYKYRFQCIKTLIEELKEDLENV